jgi:hypothetical protein
MKLKVFFARMGTPPATSADGHHVLVDGGRTSSFGQTQPALQELADTRTPLDLLSSATLTLTTSPIIRCWDVAAWAARLPGDRRKTRSRATASPTEDQRALAGSYERSSAT